MKLITFPDIMRDLILYLCKKQMLFMVNKHEDGITPFIYVNGSNSSDTEGTMISFYDDEISIDKPSGEEVSVNYTAGIEELIAKSGI